MPFDSLLTRKSTHRVCPLFIVLVGDHPDADNIEHMKSVWTLCQSLWGDIPEAYKIRQSAASGVDYEREQTRKRLLSEWLAEVSGHRVDRECKMHKFNKVCDFDVHIKILHNTTIKRETIIILDGN